MDLPGTTPTSDIGVRGKSSLSLAVGYGVINYQLHRFSKKKNDAGHPLRKNSCMKKRFTSNRNNSWRWEGGGLISEIDKENSHMGKWSNMKRESAFDFRFNRIGFPRKSKSAPPRKISSLSNFQIRKYPAPAIPHTR